MGNFWAGYMLGRNSGGGSIPPGLVAVFGAMMVFAAILYVLKGIYEAIAAVTQSAPLLSLVVVGVACAAAGVAFGTEEDVDVTNKVLTPAGFCLLGVAIFWAVFTITGLSDFDQASTSLKAPLAILSFLIVGGYLYMVIGVVRYRCATRHGAMARTASIVLLGWWAWSSAFDLPLSGIPLFSAGNFLLLATVGMLVMGVLESDLHGGTTVSSPMEG